MIEFQNVSKKYGRTAVLDHLQLSMVRGEFVSLIGASGAGKSTLIYALIGAEKIDSGHIVVDGYTIDQLNERDLQYFRRRIGVVFQDYKLLPQKTVFENVAFAMEVCGYSNSEIHQRVNEVLRVVDLENYASRFPRQLSGGEQQRVAIARALVHHPSLLVADEPTGNLDPVTAKSIIELFMKINAEGITVLLTTHNAPLVDFIHRRVVTLQHGKVISDVKHSGYHHKPVSLEIV